MMRRSTNNRKPIGAIPARQEAPVRHCRDCDLVADTYGVNRDGAPILCQCPYGGKYYHFLSDTACAHFRAADAIKQQQ